MLNIIDQLHLLKLPSCPMIYFSLLSSSLTFGFWLNHVSFLFILFLILSKFFSTSLLMFLSFFLVVRYYIKLIFLFCMLSYIYKFLRKMRWKSFFCFYLRLWPSASWRAAGSGKCRMRRFRERLMLYTKKWLRLKKKRFFTGCDNYNRSFDVLCFIRRK